MRLNVFKKNIISNLLLLAIFFSTGFGASIENLSPEKQHRKVGQMVSKILPQFHYAHKILNDKMSAQQLELYIETLDPNRNYFITSDIEEFSIYRHLLLTATLILMRKLILC